MKRGDFMKYINEKLFEKEMNKLKAENERLRMIKELKTERNKYRQKPKMEMSKKFAIYLFLLLNVIVVYSLIAMWHFMDLSYLGTLITAIAAECITYITYCTKSYKAKTNEEALNYARERDQMKNEGAEEYQYSPDNGVIDNIEN